MQQASDAAWMRQALQLAETAARHAEVPVGAVVVSEGHCIGQGYNRTISDCDPSAHAEVVALRAAAQCIANHRLPKTTLYVTLEPCVMCIGAIIQARVSRVVFAAPDTRVGAVRQLHTLLHGTQLNHHVAWHSGVLAEDSTALLTAFFQQRRGVVDEAP